MPVDRDVLDQIGLEPASQAELDAAAAISPSEFSVYMTRMELLCEEMKQNLVNMGFAPHLELSDCIVPVFSAKGDLVIGSGGTYLHAATGAIPVKYMLKHFTDDPSVGINDGDLFLCNEPIYGGIHLPDFITFIPIFYEGEIIAWGAACNHEPEVGGGEPGGYTPAAKSRFEEGLHVTPVKIAENFTLKNDISEMMAFMVRDERMFMGDMRARMATCLKMRERILELCEEKGKDFVVGLIRKMLDTISQAAKDRIRSMNDGVYRTAYFFDTVGGVEHALSVAHIAIDKKGDSLTIDLTGSSPPTGTALNAKPHMVRALLAADLMQYLFSDLPVSAAVLQPLKVIAPENTWANPPDEDAISTNLRLLGPVTNYMHTCFVKMMFDSPYRDYIITPIGTGGGQGHFQAGGRDQYGRVFGYTRIEVSNASGNGATVERDGTDAAVFWYAGFGDSRDIEWVETRYPYLALFRTMMTDQAGYGKHRGGDGVGITYIIHGASSPLRILHANSMTQFSAEPGIMGGYAGGNAPFLEIRQIPWEELFNDPSITLPRTFHDMLDAQDLIPSHPTQISFTELFRNGDAIGAVGHSAGGYGDPLERQPEAVAADVKQGICSAWTARHVYHVAFDEATGLVDEKKTARLRSTERAGRLKRGKPYHEFLKEWEQKSPPQEYMHRYGPWPWAITGESSTNGAG